MSRVLVPAAGLPGKKKSRLNRLFWSGDLREKGHANQSSGSIPGGGRGSRRQPAKTARPQTAADAPSGPQQPSALPPIYHQPPLRTEAISPALVPVDADALAIHSTVGEPIIRIPLSVFESYRAEMAELKADLIEMPDLRAHCEELGADLHAQRKQIAELQFQLRGLNARFGGQVRINRGMRGTLIDVRTVETTGLKATTMPAKLREAVDLWIATGGPQHSFGADDAGRALVKRAQRRLVAWFGWTPGQASHGLGQRSGGRVVARVRAEPATPRSLGPADEIVELRSTNEGMRKTLGEVSSALFNMQAGRKPSDTVLCGLQSMASAWAGAGGLVPTSEKAKAPAKPKPTPTQVDIEEAIELAKQAAPAKPKRTRAKKAKGAAAPLPTDVHDGVVVDGAGNVWSAAEVRRRDALDPEWMPEPNWAPDGGRLRYLEESQASGHGGDPVALADIRSGKRCGLCGRRAWRGEHTLGCPEATTAA